MTSPITATLRVGRDRGTARKDHHAFLYLIPFGLFFVIFTIFPRIQSAIFSLEDYAPGKPPTWSGLENYSRALEDPSFWLSLRNVVVLMGVSLPAQFVFGFIVANLMHSKLRGRTGLLSGVYYLPVIANLIVVTLVFQLLFEPTGMVNYFLSLVGVSPLPWLTSPDYAAVTTMILIFWKGVGWYIVYLLAGLRNIDPTFYEAARMDGANAFQQAIYVSIPQLRPIITFLVVMGIISGWQIFTEPALLFGGSLGGPANSVLTPAAYIYQQAFSSLDFGYASALSILLGVVTMTVSGVALFLGRRDR